MNIPTTIHNRWWTSLMAKAVALLIAVMVVMSLTVGAYFSSKLAASMRAQMDRRGASLLETLERHIDLRRAIGAHDAEAARLVLRHIARTNEDIYYLAALDASGEVLASARGPDDEHAGLDYFGESVASSRDPLDQITRQLRLHPLNGRAAQNDDRIRRFTQALLPGTVETADPAARELQAAAPGYLVMGLRADRINGDVRQQSIPVVLTGVLLVAAFMTFFWFIARRISRMVRFAETLASGDLTPTLPDPGMDELGRLAVALRQLQTTTFSVVGQLREAANSLDTASTEVLRSAEAQMERANRQATSVTETGATISQLREIFKHARAKAEGVIDLARVSEASSAGGDQAVQQSVRAMEDMREQVEAVASTLGRLVDQSQQIGRIIEAVNEIAEESNVLALNAAIEASSAGEAGRGFAVVAREVRSLAERSRVSTAQVKAILGEIQSAARESARVVQEGRRRAEAGVAVAQAAGQSIRQLALAISQSSNAAREIAASTQQQGGGVEQIWQAVEEIDKGAAAAANGINQLQQASQEIKQHSDRMQSVVHRYQLPTSY
ncbi:MAG: methyl-accepting chemotaxis protein [Myxococcaceae bacterium]